MKKIILTIVLATLCLFFRVNAQSQINDIKPLKVGDKLPESFWQQEHTIYQNGKTTTQTLAQYKGKLLLLDFWATWCGTCIGKLPLLDSLNQLDMKALLVNSSKTKESFAQVNRFFTESAMGKKYQQQTIIDDILLAQLFPFRQLPHYVWIDYQGRIIAFTNYLFTSVPLAQKLLAVQQRAFIKMEGR